MSKLSSARSAFDLVETAQRVIVEKQFQERVHITPLGLELLRHGHEDDFAIINRRVIKRVFLGAKHLGHFRRQEVLQIIPDGFAHAAKLFFGLVEITVGEMVVQLLAPGSVKQVVQIPQFFHQQDFIGQKRERAGQSDRLVQFKKQFQRVGNMRLRLALEESFVTALSQAGGRIHDKFGIGGKRNAAVAGEIEAVRRFPFKVRIIRSDLQVN